MARPASSTPATQIRSIANDLAAAAAARQADLTRLLRLVATDHGGDIAEGYPRRASKGAMRRTLEAKLACDLALGLEDASGTVLDALDYALVVPDESYGELIDDALDRLAGAGCEVLCVNNYLDWPTADGIDALVAVGALGGGHEATAAGTPGAFKLRLRFHTPTTWATQRSFHDLYAQIAALRPGAENVGKDFGGGEAVEIFWFADVYEDLGHGPETPAGLYLMLTTEEAQVALYLDEAGWKPSSQVELWIATAEPSITPIDEEEAAEILASWGISDELTTLE
jgi:hypothetical protein